jgi:methionine synthase I (cobalamin-dependent)
MTDRQKLLTEALESRILVIDGAMGQMLQLNMTVADYGGAHLENLTDYIV